MIKNPSDAAVRRIMKENDVVQSAIQLANSGYIIFDPTSLFPKNKNNANSQRGSVRPCCHDLIILAEDTDDAITVW